MDLSIETIKLKDCKCCMHGKIKIGTFEENINISIKHWTIEDYQRQWEEGLKRIKTKNNSCLIASIQNPAKTPYLNWWALYKRDSKIYVQNFIYYAEIYESKIGSNPFTIESCYNHIPYRRKSSDPKYEISEWSVDVWW